MESPLSTGASRDHEEKRWRGKRVEVTYTRAILKVIKQVWGAESGPSLTRAKPAPPFGTGKSKDAGHGYETALAHISRVLSMYVEHTYSLVNSHNPVR